MRQAIPRSRFCYVGGFVLGARAFSCLPHLVFKLPLLLMIMTDNMFLPTLFLKRVIGQHEKIQHAGLLRSTCVVRQDGNEVG